MLLSELATVIKTLGKMDMYMIFMKSFVTNEGPERKAVYSRRGGNIFAPK